jgi:hypothetical protein
LPDVQPVVRQTWPLPQLASVVQWTQALLTQMSPLLQSPLVRQVPTTQLLVVPTMQR